MGTREWWVCSLSGYVVNAQVFVTRIACAERLDSSMEDTGKQVSAKIGYVDGTGKGAMLRTLDPASGGIAIGAYRYYKCNQFDDLQKDSVQAGEKLMHIPHKLQISDVVWPHRALVHSCACEGVM